MPEIRLASVADVVQSFAEYVSHLRLGVYVFLVDAMTELHCKATANTTVKRSTSTIMQNMQPGSTLGNN